MAVYTCKRCGYECNMKHHLKRHLQRKNVCKPKDHDAGDLDVSILLKEFENSNQTSSTLFHCKYCQKQFNDSGNRYRHQRSCPKIIDCNDIKSLKQTVYELKKEIINLKENVRHNIITNTITNNNTFNINVNNFGNESYEHITNDFLKQCLLNSTTGVKTLIEKIHFSEEAPENKNVRMKSLKNNLVEVADNKKWVVKDANEAMDSMINKGCKLMNGFYFNCDSGMMMHDINELDTRIQSFLLSVIDKNNKHYFALRRRIFALIMEHS